MALAAVADESECVILEVVKQLVMWPVIALCEPRVSMMIVMVEHVRSGGLTEHLLLRSSEVNGLCTPRLLHNGTRGSFLRGHETGSAGIDGGDEGSLRGAGGSFDLLQRAAESSAGMLGGHFDGRCVGE